MNNYYEMQRMTNIAEELIGHVESMRDHAESIMAYCTGECERCPIKSMCDWDRNFFYEDARAIDVEIMADFVNYSYEYDRKIEEEEMLEYPPYDGWEREDY